MINSQAFFTGLKSLKGARSPALPLAACFVALGALLKDAGFNPCGFPLKESKDQKNFLDEMFQDASCYVKKDTEKNSFDVVEKDSNEESVVEVEKPNNIILPDNN